MTLDKFILELFDKQMIKFGKFNLKSGQISHIYIDLRTCISYPHLFKFICDSYYHIFKSLNFNYICGVPYSALAFASGVAYAYDLPMILKRKEVKTHGTSKILEGDYKYGDSCLILEDVITSGLSINETLDSLTQHRLIVQDICVLVDRQQGGVNFLQSLGYNVYSLINLSQIIKTLTSHKQITEEESQLALKDVKR